MRLTSLNVALIFIVTSMLCDAAMAVDGDKLASQFQTVVRPFVRQHCLECHGAKDPEATFDLSRLRSAEDVAKNFATWQHVADRVRAGEMPPVDSRQPTFESRQAVLEWSRSFRKFQAQRNAGDPGPVLARRLSVAEYNNTIRDLTGYDIRPARHFPVDRTNQAGFDNSGESLEMTPGLLTKYFEAARAVSEHLVLKPDGLGFGSHAVVVDTDRDKYCVRRIIEFYDRQNTNYADYFFAAWRLRQKTVERRGTSADEESLLAVIAREEGVSPKYLRTVWPLLRGEQNNFGPIARLRSLWKALPDGLQNRQQAKSGCEEMSEYVSSIRRQLTHSFPYLSHRGINHGTQPFVLWRNRKLAAHRRVLNEDALVVRPDDLAEQKQRLEETNKEIAEAHRRRKAELETRIDELSVKLEKRVEAKELSEYQAKQRLARARDAMTKELEQFRPKQLPREELMIPVDEALRRQHVEAFTVFCDIFPDTLFVRSRGRDFKGQPGQQSREEGKVRLLSAGFHSQMGFFRDDAPVYDLVLSKNEQRELNSLWREFDFVADISRRQHQDYLWYERSESGFIGGPEFDFARGEDEDITSQAKIERLAKIYLAKAKRTGASAQVLDAISDHYRRVNANIREVESARESAEPKHVDSLKQFAAKAFRRPLSDAEVSSIVEFYDELGNRDGLSHEEAIRDVLVWILMSPHFCYITLPSDSDKPIHPLSQFALASRLSYFLWSSMPDEQLLASAARGDLNDPKIIKSHVRRMIRDDRIRGFAQQFAGNWLGYAGFENHKGVNRERFPQFDDQLREAMSREPAEFVIDLLRRDGSLLEFIDADHTFVNDALARHYGMKIDQLKLGQWKRVDNASRFGRGGILPMSVFLTKNAHALRTSPVQRGYWVARQLLGERIPPPPPNVPELPQDESQTGEASLVQMLAKHRDHVSCAGCHKRFDSLGVVLEGFDPIGRLRDKDMGGRPVQTRIAMPDGVARTGVAGLRDYIRQQRQQDFLDTACRKLLSYSLGRTLIVADDVLLDSMRQEVQESTTSLTSLIELIVTSPPFLNQRGRNYTHSVAAENTE
jgi:hypothetical protein